MGNDKQYDHCDEVTGHLHTHEHEHDPHGTHRVTHSTETVMLTLEDKCGPKNLHSQLETSYKRVGLPTTSFLWPTCAAPAAVADQPNSVDIMIAYNTLYTTKVSAESPCVKHMQPSTTNDKRQTLNTTR
eukprot:m.67168 g.67168  ORF g.67168 m.67168 type:complete len:129 (-) comp15967_c1_seq7:2037-2423(-)